MKRIDLPRCALPGLLLAMQPLTANAGIEFSGDVTIATDYVFYGVSQTMSSPTLQGTIEFETESGWYGYVWGSNVDFTPAGATDDGADIEINAELGYSFSFGERLSASIGGVYYAFPGTYAGYDYDYSDYVASISIDERHRIAVGYSDNVFGSREPGTIVTAATYFDVSEHVAIDIEVGHYDLEHAYGHTYHYADVGASGQLDKIAWRLGYVVTGGDDTELFDASTVEERIVLLLSFSF